MLPQVGGISGLIPPDDIFELDSIVLRTGRHAYARWKVWNFAVILHLIRPSNSENSSVESDLET